MGLVREAVGALIGANPQSSKTFLRKYFQENAWSAKLLTDMGFNYLGEVEPYCVARQTTVASWTYSRRMAWTVIGAFVCNASPQTMTVGRPV